MVNSYYSKKIKAHMPKIDWRQGVDIAVLCSTMYFFSNVAKSAIEINHLSRTIATYELHGFDKEKSSYFLGVCEQKDEEKEKAMNNLAAGTIILGYMSLKTHEIEILTNINKKLKKEISDKKNDGLEKRL